MAVRTLQYLALGLSLEFQKAWSRFWFRTTHPHALALFRIAFGGFLLFYWSLKLPHVDALFSEEGIVLPLVWRTNVPPALLSLFSPPPYPIALLIFLALLAVFVFLVAGLFSRAAAGVAFALSVYYWILSLHLFGTSFDRLFIFMLLVLAFSPADRAFSLAMKLKHGSFLAWEPISILPQRILAVQVAATYLGVGWQKLVLPDWQSGEILALGFMGRWATAPAWRVIQWNLPLWMYDAMIAVVKGFELLLPFGVWIQKWKIQWWFFLGTALFFSNVALFLAIWWFLVLIPANILFLDPDALYRWLRERANGQIH
ncbi:hypothetical protein HYZ99_02750 [Candidatus Peregrinibacteria bacterium]|nr:hypothetical protein [Candidatus Peregrinibacteria bacterium]